MKNNTSKNIRKLTAAAIFAAFLCVISPWSIPIGAVPVSLSTFAVYLAGLILGRSAVWSVVCYVLLGCVGLPVFSGFSGGVGVFLGPTGGFLAGYIPAALVCGILSDLSADVRSRAGKFCGSLLSAAVSAVIVHTCGILRYMSLTGASIGAALTVCVLPFVIPECLKIAAAVMIAQMTRKRIDKISTNNGSL